MYINGQGDSHRADKDGRSREEVHHDGRRRRRQTLHLFFIERAPPMMHKKRDQELVPTFTRVPELRTHTHTHTQDMNFARTCTWGKGGQGTHPVLTRWQKSTYHDRRSHIVVQFFFGGKRKRKKWKSRTRLAALRYSRVRCKTSRHRVCAREGAFVGECRGI